MKIKNTAGALLAANQSKYAAYGEMNGEILLVEDGFATLAAAQEFSVFGDHGLSPNGNWQFVRYLSNGVVSDALLDSMKLDYSGAPLTISID